MLLHPFLYFLKVLDAFDIIIIELLHSLVHRLVLPLVRIDSDLLLLLHSHDRRLTLVHIVVATLLVRPRGLLLEVEGPSSPPVVDCELVLGLVRLALKELLDILRYAELSQGLQPND